MESDSSSKTHGEAATVVAAIRGVGQEEAAFIESLRVFVRERPLTAVAAAGACATACGILFPRLSRFVFIAAAGYVGTELWSRERKD